MKLFIVAGEASGDQLGARLLSDLRKLNPTLDVRGIGGTAMAAEGVDSIFPMQELSLMGLAEVMPKIPNIIKRLNDTVKAIHEFRPDVVLTVDIPDFNKRLARRLQTLRHAGKTKLVHYVAPTVWAWRPGRAKTMAKLFDHLLCLFPFEPPYFEAVGLSATFVGHPVAMNTPRGDATRLRAKFGIKTDQPVVCLLPGSRHGEIRRLLPVFLETFAWLKKQQPELVGILPTLPGLQAEITDAIGQAKDIHVLTEPQDKWDVFMLAAEQGGAIAASGTVSLELAAAGCPHVVAYIVHPLTAWMVRALFKLPFVNLMNILAKRAVVPEILQNDVTPENLTRAYSELMRNGAQQKTEFAVQLKRLAAHPTDIAASLLFKTV